MKKLKVSEGFLIRTFKSRDNKYFDIENEYYKNKGIPFSYITLREFFKKYFSVEEYESFEYYIDEYIKRTKEIVGYQSMKFLTSMNLMARKQFDEKILLSWNYGESKYQIINPENKELQKKKYVVDYDWGDLLTTIIKNYIDNELYKAMVGIEDFAESFITSEWLYYSLKDRKNFDYTTIISGYLKSIEQLLYKLIMLNINNGCVVAMKKDRNTKKEVKNRGIVVYDVADYKKTIIKPEQIKHTDFPYIDFVTDQLDFIDSSIGTFEYFMRINPDIFIDRKLGRVIADMVSCFRTECRNGFFHTHNLHDSSIVNKTRENAILLYAILLGSIKQAIKKKDELGIYEGDIFDSICIQLRDIRHYNTGFIFEYKDGSQKRMIYDFINNIPQYNDKGIEHYESLIFYEVPNFDLETYEKLETDIKEDWKVYLTRDSLPQRIYCFDRNKKIHEVEF